MSPPAIFSRSAQTKALGASLKFAPTAYSLQPPSSSVRKDSTLHGLVFVLAHHLPGARNTGVEGALLVRELKARAYAHASDQALIVVLVNREAAARTEVVAFDPGPGELGLRFDEETLGGLECGASKKTSGGQVLLAPLYFFFATLALRLTSCVSVAIAAYRP